MVFTLKLPRKLLVCTLAALAAGCATTPRLSTSRCDPFCSEIAACAKASDLEIDQELLCKIARCETGDRCRAAIDSPNRHYRGPFQYSRQTWRTQCGPIFRRKHLASCTGYTSMHDLCCATTCAAEMVAHGGRGNWPVCGR